MFKKLLLLGLLALAGIGYLIWKEAQPPSSWPFEVTGEFVSASYNGTLASGTGREYNTTIFLLVVTKEESDAVRTAYPKWRRMVGPTPIGGSPFVVMGREATGDWCGPLPPKDTLVRITSSGFIKGLVIKDLKSGVEYRCDNPNQ